MRDGLVLDEDLGELEGLRDARVEAAFAKTRVAAAWAAIAMAVPLLGSCGLLIVGLLVGGWGAIDLGSVAGMAAATVLGGIWGFTALSLWRASGAVLGRGLPDPGPVGVDPHAVASLRKALFGAVTFIAALIALTVAFSFLVSDL